MLALHRDVADRGLGREKQMTFTIDESVIALWPWAAGVAYFVFLILFGRVWWRHTSGWNEADRWGTTFLLLFFWPVFVVFWLITHRNGD
jgi:Zn-dependent protease